MKAVLHGVDNTDYESDLMLLLGTDKDQNIDHLLDKAKLLVGSNKELSWSQIQAEDSYIQFAIKHFVAQKVKYSKVYLANKVVKSIYRVRHFSILRNGLLYRISKSDTVYEQLVLNKDCPVVLSKLYHDIHN